MPAPKGNTYGAKPDDLKRSSRLLIPATPTEKAQVVKDAAGRKLAAYVREKLGLLTNE